MPLPTESLWLTARRKPDCHTMSSPLFHPPTARRDLVHEAQAKNYARQQEKAFALLSSSGTTAAFDIASEPLSIRERYGNTINGTSLLMARRLIQEGVPFVTVFWKEDESIAKQCKSAGGWDTHGDNFNCLKNISCRNSTVHFPRSWRISRRPACSMRHSCS